MTFVANDERYLVRVSGAKPHEQKKGRSVGLGGLEFQDS
jgi:hypothetical protein